MKTLQERNEIARKHIAEIINGLEEMKAKTDNIGPEKWQLLAHKMFLRFMDIFPERVNGNLNVEEYFFSAVGLAGVGKVFGDVLGIEKPVQHAEFTLNQRKLIRALYETVNSLIIGEPDQLLDHQDETMKEAEALLCKSPEAIEPVLIIVEGGVVQEVRFPDDHAGPAVEIRDYDNDGIEGPRLKKDDDGDQDVKDPENELFGGICISCK